MNASNLVMLIYFTQFLTQDVNRETPNSKFLTTVELYERINKVKVAYLSDGGAELGIDFDPNHWFRTLKQWLGCINATHVCKLSLTCLISFNYMV